MCGAHLFHQKHIQSFWHRYLPPGYEAQQSGLALAIGPYQAIPPASCHTQLCVLQQQLTLGSHRQAVDLHNMQRTVLFYACCYEGIRHGQMIKDRPGSEMWVMHDAQ